MEKKKKKKSSFKLDGQAFLLTYKTHLKFEQFIFLNKIENGHKILWETGETGYLHTHLLVFFKKRFQTKNCRYFDVIDIHPNINPIRTAVHWKNAVDYENANKKHNEFVVNSNTLDGYEFQYLGNLKNLIQSHEKWSDVLNDDGCDKIKLYMNWARAVHNNRPNTYRFNITEEYGGFLAWQDECLTLLKAQSKRSILWIYDSVGNSGKSELSNHIEDNFGGLVIEGGKFANIAYLWKLEEYIVFDLPRCIEDFIPYKLMECFKKGRLTSTKYQTTRKRLQHGGGCKVLVLANFLPDTERLSKDRWDIRYLDKGVLKKGGTNSLTLRELDFDESKLE